MSVGRNEYWLQEMSTDIIQQSPPDSVVEFYDLKKLDPRERWEQELINALEGFATSEARLIMEHREQQQHITTDLDIDIANNNAE